MTFPTIEAADTQSGTVVANSTSWTLTYPTNLANGDLILAFLAGDGTGWAPSFPAGFVRVNTDSGANVLCVVKKLSDGTETGNFTVTTQNEQGGWRVFRITGWEGTLGTTWSNNASSDGSVCAATATTGASANPDPGNLDPFNWATEDTLWFAACGVDTSRTVSVYPLTDNNTADVSGGAGGATLGICTSNSAVSSLNPGTFTVSASDDWAAITIAVRPAAAVADTRVPYATPYPQLLPH